MEVERFDDAAVFEREVGAYLLENEAAHNLSLGLLFDLQEEDGPYADVEPLLAVVRDPSGVPALVAVRTPPFNLVLSLATDPAAVGALADHLVGSGPDGPHVVGPADLPGVIGPVDLAERFADRWAARTGAAWRPHLSMRCFAATRARHPVGVSGRMRPVNEGDRSTVSAWGRAFQLEALDEEPDDERHARWTDRLLQPSESRGLVVWEVDGELVSMAGFGRPTRNGMSVYAVYTPPGLRRRGYATACVAALTQRLLDDGRRFCFLFTDLANPTSNAIYRWIGYEPVLDASELRFEAPKG